ncbi:MAG: hypothetical protein Aureis2KO_18210 [Aureisphaera sp.]
MSFFIKEESIIIIINPLAYLMFDISVSKETNSYSLNMIYTLLVLVALTRAIQIIDRTVSKIVTRSFLGRECALVRSLS